MKKIILLMGLLAAVGTTQAVQIFQIQRTVFVSEFHATVVRIGEGVFEDAPIQTVFSVPLENLSGGTVFTIDSSDPNFAPSVALLTDGAEHWMHFGTSDHGGAYETEMFMFSSLTSNGVDLAGYDIEKFIVSFGHYSTTPGGSLVIPMTFRIFDTTPSSVPDGGATALMLGLGLLGMVCLKRRH